MSLMLLPPASIRSQIKGLACAALQDSAMDCVGLYRFDSDGAFDCGVIVGMPDPFTPRYEITGIPIDPILAEMRRGLVPVSTETMLGERWKSCHLFRQVSGEFGLKGFAALPLFEMDRLAGIVYLGALTEANRARLHFEGICRMTTHAAKLSGALFALPRKPTSLTPRQNEVAHWAAAGLSNREIATKLGTGEASVRKHLKALNLIFGAHNRTAMAARWRSETHGS